MTRFVGSSQKGGGSCKKGLTPFSSSLTSNHGFSQYSRFSQKFKLVQKISLQLEKENSYLKRSYDQIDLQLGKIAAVEGDSFTAEISVNNNKDAEKLTTPTNPITAEKPITPEGSTTRKKPTNLMGAERVMVIAAQGVDQFCQFIGKTAQEFSNATEMLSSSEEHDDDGTQQVLNDSKPKEETIKDGDYGLELKYGAGVDTEYVRLLALRGPALAQIAPIANLLSHRSRLSRLVPKNMFEHYPDSARTVFTEACETGARHSVCSGALVGAATLTDIGQKHFGHSGIGSLPLTAKLTPIGRHATIGNHCLSVNPSLNFAIGSGFASPSISAGIRAEFQPVFSHIKNPLSKGTGWHSRAQAQVGSTVSTGNHMYVSHERSLSGPDYQEGKSGIKLPFKSVIDLMDSVTEQVSADQDVDLEAGIGAHISLFDNKRGLCSLYKSCGFYVQAKVKGMLLPYEWGTYIKEDRNSPALNNIKLKKIEPRYKGRRILRAEAEILKSFQTKPFYLAQVCLDSAFKVLEGVFAVTLFWNLKICAAATISAKIGKILLYTTAVGGSYNQVIQFRFILEKGKNSPVFLMFAKVVQILFCPLGGIQSSWVMAFFNSLVNRVFGFLPHSKLPLVVGIHPFLGKAARFLASVEIKPKTWQAATEWVGITLFSVFSVGLTMISSFRLGSLVFVMWTKDAVAEPLVVAISLLVFTLIYVKHSNWMAKEPEISIQKQWKTKMSYREVF